MEMHDRCARASAAYTLRDEIVDPDRNQGLAFPAPTAVERHFEPNPVLSGHRRSSVNKPPILSRIVAGCALSRRQELLGCVERRLDLAMSCFERSEEPTSELQSLMRISYAVFCLKNNKTEQKPQEIKPLMRY